MSVATGVTGGAAALRAARRDRVFAAMGEAGLDAMVLSRRDTIAYATGAAKLWTASTRPFNPSCVLIASGRATHLLSSWDEGVPPEVPFEHLYGVTWNPAIMGEALAAIDGLADARRIGVDGLSVGTARMLGRIAPGAAFVPADDLLQAVRVTKLPAEVDVMRAACAVAASSVAAATAALSAGASPAAALDAAIRAAAAEGVTIPSSAPVVEATADGLVRVDVGVLLDDYEGGQGRTVAVDPAAADAVAAAVAAHDRLVAACVPGATAADLRAAAAGADGWRIRGTGLGFEAPVVTDTLGDAVILAADMTLSVDLHLAAAHHRTHIHLAPTPTPF